METTSVLFGNCKVKCLSLRVSTLNGPSYGGCSGFLTQSCLTKTCVHHDSVLLTCDLCWSCGRTGGGFRLLILALSLVTYAVG